ncbi:MAG: protease modulator HflC [Pirellula sp.]
MKYTAITLAAIALVLILAPLFVFILDEREMAVVLRFGAPKHSYTEPGLYGKIPFADSVRRIPKIKQFWGDSKHDLMPDLPTIDDKKIELIPWAIWRVNDPVVFVQRLRSMDVAEQRVEQIVRSSIRDVVTKYDLEEFVRSTNRELYIGEASNVSVAERIPSGVPAEIVQSAQQNRPKRIQFGRAQILDRIKREAQKRLLASVENEPSARGIELIDVGISQIGFVDSVRRKTFDRWVAERQAISAKNVNEGERLKSAIINETNAEVARIEGEGQQRASETKGRTDADIIKRYAEATQQTGEFFTFVRTLEAYEKSIHADSQIILTTDSPFFRLFNDKNAK